LPRSSIVISDEPLSEETNYRTEFVAVLSDQPQGGFITRKPTENVLVADDNGQAYGNGQDYGNGWGGTRQQDDGFGFFFQRNPQPQPSNTRRRGGQYVPPVQRGFW
jgi:hypothetical protein